MKLFVNHFNEKDFEKHLDGIKHIDFSLFINKVPQSQDQLSLINIIALAEPNEYFGWNKWIIGNQNIFDIIFTFEDNILNNCDNSRFVTLGHTWMKPEQYSKERNKKFELAHLCGLLKKAPGHFLRHELIDRENEIKIPTRFFSTYGDRYNIEEARIGREKVYADSQFNVAIENVSRRGWFTEKLIDCFLFKSIPLYWGCSNVDDFFNSEGIIKVDNVDDIVYISNQLTDSYYKDKIKILEENYQESLKWLNYEKKISDEIKNIFKHNNLI